MRCFNLFRAFNLSVVFALMALFWGNTAHAGWSQPVRISEFGGTGNVQIIARGDTLHLAYIYVNYEGTRHIHYQRSTDGGLTWGNNRVLLDSALALFPRLINSDSRLMAIWKRALNGYYRYTIQYCISTNRGRSWSSPQNAIDPGTPEDFYFAASCDTGLNICLVYNTSVNDSMTFFNLRSTDFGQSWSSPSEIFRTLVSDIPDQISVNNYVHLVWAGYFNQSEAGDVYYNRSTDGGQSWSGNFPLSTIDSHPSEISSICSFGDSNLAVCWTDFKYSPYLTTGDILMRSSIDGGINWGLEGQASNDHFAWGSDIALNTDTIHVVWTDEGTGIGHRSIYYTRSTDDGTTWSEPYWIDGTLDDSYYPAIAVSNGRVYVVWGNGTYNSDTTSHWGLYFSRYVADNDAVYGGGENNMPNKISLMAYPNPFNSSVTITYSNLKGGEIGIYDIQGKLIKTLKTEGGENGKIIWDASDALGNKVSSGEYFLKAGTSQSSSGLKLLYLK